MSSGIIVADGVDFSPQQLDLLELAYRERNITKASIITQYNTGKSGATVYLAKVGPQEVREIVKFDHPYALQGELDAYRSIVETGTKNHRAFLVFPLLPQENDEPVKVLAAPDDYSPRSLGILMFSFQGSEATTFVDSLKDYYNKHGGQKTGDVLRRLVTDFLHILSTAIDENQNAPFTRVRDSHL